MDRAAPTLDPALFNDNLTALAEAQPELAHALSALTTENPDLPELAYTRDHQLSFKLGPTDSDTHWFGMTSLPATRAAALIEKFDAGQANVLLAGFSHGSEVALLLARLACHRAVFVWESDLHSLRLAFMLHDFHRDIRNRRLIIIHAPADAFANQLQTTLNELPGCLCPIRILLWPWHTLATIAPIRVAVENVYQRIEQQRHQTIAELTGRLVSLPEPDPTTLPQITLLSHHARDETWNLSHALARSADDTIIESTVQSPADMHMLARLQRLTDQLTHQPQCAILIDAVRSQFTELIAPDTPVIAWLGSDFNLPDNLLSTLGPKDKVAVRSPRVHAQLRDQSFPEDRMFPCPPPCLMNLDEQLPSDRPFDVVLLADNISRDPKAHGFTFATHESIWHHAVKILETTITSYTPQQAQSLLSRAERAASLRLDEPRIHQAMTEALTARLARSFLARELSQHLVDHGLKVILAGQGWPEKLPVALAGPAVTLQQQRQALLSARVYVHLTTDGNGTDLALLAAGCGTAMVALAHPLDDFGGKMGCGLAKILPKNEAYLPCGNFKEALSAVVELARSAEKRAKIAQNARNCCAKSHLPAHRLATCQIAVSSYPA